MNTNTSKINTSGKTAQQPEELVNFITQENAAHQVTIWSKSYCPHCKATKDFFKSFHNVNDIATHDLDVMENGSFVQHYLKKVTGSRTVPVVFVNNHYVGGNSDVQQLHEEGQLAKLLKEDAHNINTAHKLKNSAKNANKSSSKECALEKTANKLFE